VLAKPLVAAAFTAFSIMVIVVFGAVTRRWLPSLVVPILVVVAYTNMCLAIAAGWAQSGGHLLPFLLSTRTLTIVAIALALLAAALALHHWLVARRATLMWRSTVPAILLVGLAVWVIATSRRIPEAHAKHAPASDSIALPDIYVLSFDALRADSLAAYVAEHPASNLAAFMGEATKFENVVSHGASTDLILANNTFVGDVKRTCPTSTPRRMASRGYFTAMILGAVNMRFDGSICFDYFSSGDGESFADLYMLPSLAHSLVRGRDPVDYKYLRSNVLLDRLERVARNPNPIFAYVHFLELHAPYMPRPKVQSEKHRSTIREYMRRCFLVACDPADPTSRRLIEYARQSYVELLDEVDAAVERAVGIARHRGRDFKIIITADHGELFGEHRGFAHTGGFVPELLDIPFVVRDSRNTSAARRCELMRGSDAIAAAVLEQPFTDAMQLRIDAPPLGFAFIDKQRAELGFHLSPAVVPHAGTWRNIHRQQHGTLPYPIETCQ
jgi:hypothetical protein